MLNIMMRLLNDSVIFAGRVAGVST